MSSFALGSGYIEATTVTLDREKFASLLSDNVSLYHQTNDEKPFEVEGKSVVVDLFQKYIFGNSSKFVSYTKSADARYEVVDVKLFLSEDKEENGVKNRYDFEESTTLTCRNNLIIKIHTTVARKFRGTLTT